MVQDGRVHVVGHDGLVFALDAANGSQLWSKRPAGGWMHSMPAIADGRLFVGFQGGILVALDTATGDELWRYANVDPTHIFGNLVGSSPAVDADTVSLDQCAHVRGVERNILPMRQESVGQWLNGRAGFGKLARTEIEGHGRNLPLGEHQSVASALK